MTDKEQIIIDGVDVSECAYFDYENEGTRECDVYGNECEANNCYYKQLARKTQEYQNLADILRDTDTYSEVCSDCKDDILTYAFTSKRTNYTDNEVDVRTLRRIINVLKSITQECEKLKEENELLESQMAFNLSEMEIRLGNEVNRNETLLKELKRFDKIKDEFREMSEQLKTKNDRYRKALDEIEEECNYAPMCDTEFSQRVLDIINKTKGERNND